MQIAVYAMIIAYTAIFDILAGWEIGGAGACVTSWPVRRLRLGRVRGQSFS